MLRPTPTSASSGKAPLWSRRGLVFPEPIADAAPPMWDRPPTRSPIFLDAQPSPSPMWDRPSTESPIFVDEAAGEPQMWNRPRTPASVSAVCPCCRPGTAFLHVPIPPIPSTPVSVSSRPFSSRPATAAAAPVSGRPRTSAGPGAGSGAGAAKNHPALKSKSSMMSLRLKKSFRSLRRRATDDSA